MFGSEWTSEYYDVMDFYYWEPQHLGKIKNPRSKYHNPQKSLEHIQKMEVSLNHMFNVFFRLAPSNFTNNLLAEVCNICIEDKFSMCGSDVVMGFSKSVQPDLLFTSDDTNFSIEMKIRTKSSLEQVYKYALLHWLEQQHSNKNKQSVLLYIGIGSFQNLWSDKFISEQNLIDSVLSSDLNVLKSRVEKFENIDINWTEVDSILSNTIIRHCTYDDFNNLLNKYIKSSIVETISYETLTKLFNGLSLEMKRRRLTL